MTSGSYESDSQSYWSALAQAALTYLAVGPLLIYLVDYVAFPLATTGRLNEAPLATQVGEFVAYFFAGVWGILSVFPLVAILRSRRKHRRAWGATTGAAALVVLACVFSPALAFSPFVIGLAVAGAVFGYVATMVVRNHPR